MAWFVVYQLASKTDGKRSNAHNAILQDQHPLVWCAAPLTHTVTYLLWFTEIPDQLIEAVAPLKYFDVTRSEGG
jgi:hypothetical protein